MARARASDNARSRSKAVLIDEIGRGIEQFQDVLTSIEDFSREGFPYRDAARAKAELQLRECVRRIFGERSQEFQTYRNHKLRVSNKAETAQSIALVKQLIHALEDKRLELQGLKPAAADSTSTNSSTTPPPLSLVPPLPPATQVTLAPQPAATPPMTVSVAMTTNLGMPAVPLMPTQPPSAPPSAGQPQPMTPPPAPPVPSSIPPMPPAPIEPAQPNVAPDRSAPISAPVAAPAVTEPVQALPPASADTPGASAQKRIAPAPERAAASAPLEPAVQRAAPTDSRFADPLYKEDSLELIRKVCLRFHAVTRQLRLRKDYRATLEVEDDYDLQDLLCALLKVEFEEVGLDEWIPPYANGAPRTAFLLHRDQIAVVAKKTRPGLTTKELADQVAADSAYYGARENCSTLFCFIYDPEGRIGSPKRLETDLTSVSDRYMIEVLVAPK